MVCRRDSIVVPWQRPCAKNLVLRSIEAWSGASLGVASCAAVGCLCCGSALEPLPRNRLAWHRVICNPAWILDYNVTTCQTLFAKHNSVGENGGEFGGKQPTDVRDCNSRGGFETQGSGVELTREDVCSRVGRCAMRSTADLPYRRKGGNYSRSIEYAQVSGVVPRV
jgi:hypothetical protein